MLVCANHASAATPRRADRNASVRVRARSGPFRTGTEFAAIALSCRRTLCPPMLSARPLGRAMCGFVAPFPGHLLIVDAHKERLAMNETIFRQVNEQIEQIASPDGRSDGHVFGFICECSNLDCNFMLPLTVRAYEEVRANPQAFVVAPGHELPEIESVIARRPEYQVVLKRGEAAEMARENNPRS